MRAFGTGSKSILFGAGWVFSLLFTAQMAAASTPASKHGAKHGHSAPAASAADRSARAYFPGGNATRHASARYGKRQFAAYGSAHGYRGPMLQCVAYARSASNISLSGNGADWWANAEGVYARGNRPQPGSVLAFTANGRMRLGHVSVVSRVINGRVIEVDHANWGGHRGAVARGVQVVDVSPNNDWTAVRVALSNSGEFGSVYPTYGFIYDRPDNGVRVASVSRPSPTLALNPAPADLRPAYGRQTFTVRSYNYDEVAEAPALAGALDRPDRSLR